MAFAAASIVIACDRVDRRIERYADELSLIHWNARQTFLELMLTISQAVDAGVGLDSAVLGRFLFRKLRRAHLSARRPGGAE